MKYSKLAICLILPLILGTCLKQKESSVTNNDINEYYLLGLKYYFNMDFDSALSLFNEAISVNPTLAKAHAGIGNTYFALSEYTNSIEAYKLAVQYDNKYQCFLYGIESLLSGDYNIAIHEFSKAIEENIDIFIAYDFRCNVYHEIGKYNEAIGDYSHILEEYPDYLPAYLGRALSYLAKLDMINAINEINEVIKRNPNNYYLRNIRGLIYFAQSEIESTFGNQDRAYEFLSIAMNDFDYILSMEPSKLLHYVIVAAVYNFKGLYDNSIINYSKAINIDPNNHSVYNLRGDVFLKNNKYDLAINDQNIAITLNSNSASAYLSLAEIYMLESKFDQAIMNFNLALSKNPNIISAYIQLYNIYHSRAYFRNAVNMAKEIIRISQNLFLGYFLLGVIDNNDSLYNLTKALQLVPNGAIIKQEIEYHYNTKKLDVKFKRGIVEFYIPDGRIYAKGNIIDSNTRSTRSTLTQRNQPNRDITLITTERSFKLTHIYDRNNDALIPIENYLKKAVELGVSQELLDFMEKNLNQIFRSHR